ncbi:hypothetical protein EMIHUDRAFT_435799, partial [Emiliania huxleyi CCMP1516]
ARHRQGRPLLHLRRHLRPRLCDWRVLCGAVEPRQHPLRLHRQRLLRRRRASVSPALLPLVRPPRPLLVGPARRRLDPEAEWQVSAIVARARRVAGDQGGCEPERREGGGRRAGRAALTRRVRVRRQDAGRAPTRVFLCTSLWPGGRCAPDATLWGTVFAHTVRRRSYLVRRPRVC